MDAETIGQPASALHGRAEIEEWLVVRLARAAGVAPAEIDAEQKLVAFEIDSSVTVSVTSDLGAWLGMNLPVTLFWEYPTIRAVASVLADQLEAKT